MTNFGDWIRQTRETKGYDSNDCARRANMHSSVWSNWENGRSRRKDGQPTQPRPATVCKIARGLRVSEALALKIAYEKEAGSAHEENNPADSAAGDIDNDILRNLSYLDRNDKDVIYALTERLKAQQPLLLTQHPRPPYEVHPSDDAGDQITLDLTHLRLVFNAEESIEITNEVLHQITDRLLLLNTENRQSLEEFKTFIAGLRANRANSKATYITNGV